MKVLEADENVLGCYLSGAGPTLNNIDTVTAMIPMKAGGIGSKIKPTTRPAKILT